MTPLRACYSIVRTFLLSEAGAVLFRRRTVWLFAILSLSCSGQDRTTSEELQPGLRYTVFQRQSVPNQIHVIEVDLAAGHFELAAVKSGPYLRGTQPLSATAGHDDIIAAVNGDFFSMEGVPSGAQFTDGLVVKEGAESWQAFGITNDRRLFIDPIRFTGTVHTKSVTLPVDGFNRTRRDNEIILYNRYFGVTTQTNQYGSEATIRVLRPGRFLGDTTLGLVVSVDSARGSSLLSDSVLVLSVHGTQKQSQLHRLSPGDRVHLVTSSQPFYGRLAAVIGGYPLLVRNGKNVVLRNDALTNEFSQVSLSRTALGFSNPSRKLFLVCVDGGQPNYSLGLSLSELADFMIEMGCDQALNLDGGGSTTMMVRGRLVNRPSEGAERPISNALVIRKTRP